MVGGANLISGIFGVHSVWPTASDQLDVFLAADSDDDRSYA